MSTITPLITRANVWEDQSVVLMARVYNTAGDLIQQSGLSSIAYEVWNMHTPPVPVSTASGTLTISSVVYNTLQTDAEWTKDSTGFNFRGTIPASCFTTPDRTYRIEIEFTPTSGDPFFAVYEIYVAPILGS